MHNSFECHLDSMQTGIWKFSYISLTTLLFYILHVCIIIIAVVIQIMYYTKFNHLVYKLDHALRIYQFLF